MTGSALVTTSPSSSNCRRSTPWVDGCDGPIESDIFSDSNSFGTLAAFAAASGNENSVAIALLGFGAALVPRLVLGPWLGLAHRSARFGHEGAPGHRRGDEAGLGLRRDLGVRQVRRQAGQ